MNKNTTSYQNYCMPAEWEKHEGTWLQRPYDKNLRGYQMSLERIWLTMVDILHKHENVHIIVGDETHKQHVERQLEYYRIGPDNIDLMIIPTDDVWARDNGPIFVTTGSGNLAINDWKFNGWGGRFDYRLDNKVPSVIGMQHSVPVIKPSMVLEGGAVEVNGSGTFMATKTSIINPNQNPGKGQGEIDKILSEYLGTNGA